MLTYIVRRSLEALPVMLGVLLITFAVTRYTPGDPAEIMAGLEASQETVEAIRSQLGLDRPVPVQFAIYARDVLSGDFGRSYYLARPVSDIIGAALPRTAWLALVALVFTIAVGVPTGVLSAMHKDSWLDVTARSVALFGVSVPPFFAALIAILVFSHYVKWFPSFGSGSWRHVVLPGITLGLFSAGLVMRLTRSAMLDVLRQDYVRTARAKGLSRRAVEYKHALRNASISVITVLGLQLGSMLSGAVLVENVFSYPGIGRLLVASIFTRDYAIVQALVLLIAAIYVATNLLVDALYSLADPRIRYQ